MKPKETIQEDFKYRSQIDRDWWFLKGQLIFGAILFLLVVGYLLI